SFAGRQWIVGDQYTLADIVMAPMLYRLEAYKVELSAYPHIAAYRDRLMEREAFQRSLSEEERMLYYEG
ncbi:MAG: glutathione S-transferase family protein, partial [Zetaproteobacteria bacterium]